MADILLVDDQQNPRKAISILLKNEGYDVEEAKNGKEALHKLKSQFFDLVITDLKMENVNGMQLLKETRTLYPATEVIVITAYGTIESGVEAMKLGAYDYITKPFNNDEFLLLVKRALDKRKTLKDVDYLQQQLDEKYKFENIIGKSLIMENVLKLVAQVARTDSTVLINGESGTGKELVAKAIHMHSQRRDRPMITINCGSLPESLLESELFGHVKGAFTGAIRDKKGLFQEADAGSVFLDEIGEVTPQTQIRLLRFLQEGEIRRVGDNRSIRVDVRLIAATNKILEDEVENGNFREDLFYRLNVIPIHLPPLRQRKEDIPLLAGHFLRKYAQKLNKHLPSISPTAMALLMNQPWYGNVRELENLFERLMTLTNKPTIEIEDININLPKNRKDIWNRIDKKDKLTLAEQEKWTILDTLENYSGNQKLTAKLLGISTTTLWRKLKDYGINPAEIRR